MTDLAARRPVAVNSRGVMEPGDGARAAVARARPGGFDDSGRHGRRPVMSGEVKQARVSDEAVRRAWLGEAARPHGWRGRGATKLADDDLDDDDDYVDEGEEDYDEDDFEDDLEDDYEEDEEDYEDDYDLDFDEDEEDEEY